MAFKRSGVRLPLSPPNANNTNPDEKSEFVLFFAKDFFIDQSVLLRYFNFLSDHSDYLIANFSHTLYGRMTVFFVYVV